MSPAPFPLTASVRDRLGRLGQEFLAEVYDLETTRHPENLEALSELAHVLTRLGRLAEGLEIDRRLAELAPHNPTIRYNLACSLALLGRADEALDALSASIDLGYDDPEHLAADEDLGSLREHERFQELLSRLQGRDEHPA